MNSLEKIEIHLTIIAVITFLGFSTEAQNPESKESCCDMTLKGGSGCVVQPTSSSCVSTCATSCSPNDCVTACTWEDPAKMADKGATQGISQEFVGSKNMSAQIESIRAKYKVPALVGGAANSKGEVAFGFSGVRASGGKETIQLEDRFHLGSCSKAITATLAARLVETGKISMETTIADVYPELIGKINPGFRAATLHQLLSHRAGIPQLVRDSGSEMWKSLLELKSTPKEQRLNLIEIVLEMDPLAPGGMSFNYSDLSYTIAGAMLEQVTGKEYENLVSEYIAQPLSITTLGFGAPGSTDKYDQPRGHVAEGNVLKAISPGPFGDLAAPVISPSGTIHMSILDWSRFAAMQLTGMAPDGTKLLSAEILKKLHQDDYQQNYALGWVVTDVDWSNQKVYTHIGSCGAWAAVVWIVPEHDIALVAASNYGGPEGFRACSEAIDLMREKIVNTTGVAAN